MASLGCSSGPSRAAPDAAGQDARSDDAADGSEAEAAIEPLTVVPYPRSYQGRPGRFAITSATRVVAASSALAPLAQVLARDIEALAGVAVVTSAGPARDGDIVLAIDASLQGEAHVVDVDRVATVSGADYQAVAFATSTLLQAVRADPPPASTPRFLVRDEPALSFRGLMLDLATLPHPFETLESFVVLCRHYKIRFLHLHFTDDLLFTFPSAAYPAVATPGSSYTLAQMAELEQFARARGVEIIPELDMPGHSAALARAAPGVFDCDTPIGMICPARANIYGALDTLIGEMMGAFPSARYFHLGADEVDASRYDGSAECRAYMAAQGIADGSQLYKRFVTSAVGLVKARGRQAIVWEGFDPTGTVDVPRDTKVMVFESLYATAPELISLGFSVINTSWQPLYVVNDRAWSPEYIYGWNAHRWEHFIPTSKAYPNPIVIDPTPNLLGAELCAWEQPSEIELPTTRLRLAAMSERVYNPEAGRTYTDFAARLAVTDQQLDKLLR